MKLVTKVSLRKVSSKACRLSSFLENDSKKSRCILFFASLFWVPYEEMDFFPSLKELHSVEKAHVNIRWLVKIGVGFDEEDLCRGFSLGGVKDIYMLIII